MSAAEQGRAEVEELGDSAIDMWETFVTALPRAGVALIVLLLLTGLGRLLRPLLQRRLCRKRTPSFARVMSRLAGGLLTAAGALFAVTIVFPSVRPVDLVSGAGILSVAAGFAFKDILQNLLAGVLILFRQPFRGGDQIQVGDVAGTVEEINVRETVVRTFDGRRVLIPNATVYTDVIEVQTAHPTRRIEVPIGVRYGTDLDHATRVAAAAIRRIDGVARSPEPEVLVGDVGASEVLLEALVWCDDPHQLAARRVRSQVIVSLLDTFEREDIEVPFEVLTIRPSAELLEAVRPPSHRDG